MPFVTSSKPSGTPLVVAVMFVAGPRTPVLFSSDEVPPVVVVFDGCLTDLNVMSNDIITYTIFRYMIFEA